MKATKTPEPPKRPEPSLTLYRRIAVSFVAVTCLLLGLVVYLSFAEATIVVTPEPQSIVAEKELYVVADPASEKEISGAVLSTIFEQAKVFTLEGTEGETVEAKAGGLVTIYNTHTANQTLVATTRLLSPDGILFRIDDTVTVPAGGEVTVMAHADEVGKQGEVAPTRFTIPGLNATLQEKIYAENAETFTGGEVTVTTLTQEALDGFAAELEQEMRTAAEAQLAQQAGSYDRAAYMTEIIERKSDTEPGAETGQVTLSMRVRLTGVFYMLESVWEQLEADLSSAVPDDLELSAVDTSSIMVNVGEVNADAGTAVLNASIEAPATLSAQSDLLDPERFVGKSAADVIKELEAYDLIQSVSVRVTPFWLKRLPSLQDHIKVEVE